MEDVICEIALVLPLDLANTCTVLGWFSDRLIQSSGQSYFLPSRQKDIPVWRICCQTVFGYFYGLRVRVGQEKTPIQPDRVDVLHLKKQPVASLDRITQAQRFYRDLPKTGCDACASTKSWQSPDRLAFSRKLFVLNDG
ncbi:MAG: hypothetical protein NWP79_00470 [Paracoccaceae bacterium]|nr:hypothetical protein [Paracoccaceae bacterium]